MYFNFCNKKKKIAAIFLLISLFAAFCSCKKEKPLNEDRIYVYNDDEFNIYDPSDGYEGDWYVNDHCFIKDKKGTWHLFGITNTWPFETNKEVNFAHAVSQDIVNARFKRLDFAMTADLEKYDERVLWAPYIIYNDGLYYMFYCAGGKSPDKLQIHIATSEDLYNWERYENNPIIMDGYDARDPMVINVDGEWYMYYTATSTPTGGNYVVKCSTSDDLLSWSEGVIVYRDDKTGTLGGNCESPFVYYYKGYYFLFIGPRGAMNETHVFVSKDPFDFNITKPANKVGTVWAHAPEVIEYDGKLWVSDCLREGGVYLSQLHIIEAADGVNIK